MLLVTNNFDLTSEHDSDIEINNYINDESFVPVPDVDKMAAITVNPSSANWNWRTRIRDYATRYRKRVKHN